MCRKTSGNLSKIAAVDGEETYTVQHAIKLLGLGERRVRQLVESGEIEGYKAGNQWQLFRHAVHNYRDAHPPNRSPREAPELPESVRDLVDRVATLERELGRSEGRLELTERAESTIREERDRLLAELDRERQRGDEERFRADQERTRAESLERELEEARRPWWRRWFG